jgi:hypothetical protein
MEILQRLSEANRVMNERWARIKHALGSVVTGTAREVSSAARDVSLVGRRLAATAFLALEPRSEEDLHPIIFGEGESSIQGVGLDLRRDDEFTQKIKEYKAGEDRFDFLATTLADEFRNRSSRKGQYRYRFNLHKQFGSESDEQTEKKPIKHRVQRIVKFDDERLYVALSANQIDELTGSHSELKDGDVKKEDIIALELLKLSPGKPKNNESGADADPRAIPEQLYYHQEDDGSCIFVIEPINKPAPERISY